MVDGTEGTSDLPDCDDEGEEECTQLIFWRIVIDFTITLSRSGGR